VPASDGGHIIIESYFRGGGGATFGPVKIDAEGNVVWKTEYKQQNSVSSYGTCGIATSEGGYLLGGRAIIDNYDRGWVYKTDSRGEMQWNKTYDDANEIKSVAELQDGGYVMVGSTNQSLNYYGEGSAWIAKTNGYGDLLAEGKAGAISVSRDFSTVPPWIYSYHSWVLEAPDRGYVCVGIWNRTFDASPDQKFWLSKFSPSIVPPTYYYMSLSASPTSASLGSPVTISGRLYDSYGRSLENKTVVLTYTFEGYFSWIPISSDATDVNGMYSIQWANTASGTFTIRAEWVGNATISKLANATSLSIMPFDSNSIFYLESSSNVSGLNFDSSSNSLRFSVSGPSGTTGYAKVTLPKTVVGDSSSITVLLDGVSQNYSLTSSQNALIILFTYTHSSHQIVILLANLIPEFTHSLLLPLLFLTPALLFGAILFKSRKIIKLRRTQPEGTAS
jgi:hypothetical protein